MDEFTPSGPNCPLRINSDNGLMMLGVLGLNDVAKDLAEEVDEAAVLCRTACSEAGRCLSEEPRNEVGLGMSPEAAYLCGVAAACEGFASIGSECIEDQLT